MDDHALGCLIASPEQSIGDAGLGLRVEIADAFGGDISMDNDFFNVLFQDLSDVMADCAAALIQ